LLVMRSRENLSSGENRAAVQSNKQRNDEPPEKTHDKTNHQAMITWMGGLGGMSLGVEFLQ
jgi:hypothetical protein